jgi:hypothetical protein
VTLPDLLELMAKHKALKVKTADFEVELHPVAFLDVAAPEAKQGPFGDENGEGQCTCGHTLTEHSGDGLCLRGCSSDGCGPMNDARHDP